MGQFFRELALSNMKAFVFLASVLVAVSAAPSGPVVVGYGGGQTSHQSVSRPFGEQRSIVQSKAFGAAHASVSQVDNSKGLSEIQPALGAARPVAVGHAAVAHAAPIYPDEPSPYTYTYGVNDDYSNANFNAAETGDGNGNAERSYSVALPDGRIQHVNYKADGYEGYVADVTYEGTAAYPEAPVVKAVAPVAAYAG